MLYEVITPELDPDELNEIECNPVQSTDIGCFDGVVTLSVNELVFRYGLSKREFIINMNVVDMLIARDHRITSYNVCYTKLLRIDAYGPQFKVYYDPTGTMDGPSQMVVFLDERTLINCREIELPIGERLPELDRITSYNVCYTKLLRRTRCWVIGWL